MSRTFNVRTTRRGFMAAASGAVVAGVAAAGAGQVALGQGGEVWSSADAHSIMLHDAQVQLPAEMTLRLRAQGVRIVSLVDDPVRLWRSGLKESLQHPQARLYGLTRWADLVLVRGLAAESRKHLRHEQLSAETGYFSWLIA